MNEALAELKSADLLNDENVKLVISINRKYRQSWWGMAKMIAGLSEVNLLNLENRKFLATVASQESCPEFLRKSPGETNDAFIQRFEAYKVEKKAQQGSSPTGNGVDDELFQWFEEACEVEKKRAQQGCGLSL